MEREREEGFLHERQATDFDAIKLGLAAPEQILEWSHGKVTKPETINYRTLRPERDGLFDERIFGPTRDWECYCGKYKGTHYRGVTCDRCGVLVARSIIRRERMGHIELAVPVTHIWYLRGTASTIGLVLNMTGKNLEKIVYFAAYVVTKVDEAKQKQILTDLTTNLKTQRQKIKQQFEADAAKKNADIKALAEQQDNAMAEAESAFNYDKTKIEALTERSLLGEAEYRDLSKRYPHLFEAHIGGQAIQVLLEQIDLGKLVKDLAKEAEGAQGQRRRKVLKRLKLLESMRKSGISPQWMILKNLPVIPPDLRPMVQLPGGRFATSDLNDLYRRVINRNNRLQKLIDIKAPEVILRNEMRMLQEAVDALIDNAHARSGRAVSTTGGRRRLKSLSDMLRGKQGRFRQNLLGKRVDYSGRSVIVAGPELSIDECGLPKMMALELFKPFVIGKLIERELAHNVKMAGRMIERGETEVWDALDEVIKEKYVLLNRAPTLHRLSVQAFKPVLIEGKAIQLHPLVCAGFNADFDGDQMAVHLPLSRAAQAEARLYMAANRNLLRPNDGNSIIYVAQDMVLGIYYVTYERYGLDNPKHIFESDDEAAYAFAEEQIEFQTPIRVPYKGELRTTTYGRVRFNQVLPEDMPFYNDTFDVDLLQELLTSIFDQYGEEVTAEVADRIKELGFEVATRSGLSTGMDDYSIPVEKPAILAEGEKRAIEISNMYSQGLITDDERKRLTIDAWQEVNQKLKAVLEERFLKEDNSTTITVVSKARASLSTVAQLAGMKGLIQDVYGETIELPIKSNYKEGFSPLEYFSSARGSRKGLVDTALRTADAGYLTRRLVDVAQDIFTTEEDCGDNEGISIDRRRSEESGQSYAFTLAGRILAQNVTGKGQKVLAKAGVLITKELATRIADDESITEVTIRSVLKCRTLRGTCRTCYGVDLGRGAMVGLRVPVGVIAAQAVGEPGTQLTLRTFHRGGTAEADITHGFSRIEELFEARNPKGQATLAEIGGVVSVREEKDNYHVVVSAPEARIVSYPLATSDDVRIKDGQILTRGDVIAVTHKGEAITAKNDGVAKVLKKQINIASAQAEAREYVIPMYRNLLVKEGDLVSPGQRVTSGSINLQDLLLLTDESTVQRYVMTDIQAIYNMQGQTIADKHLEIIVRQMLSRVQIEEPGDSLFVTGDIVNKATVIEENERLLAAKKQPAVFKQLLLGVARVAGWSDSFLSAASFQDTTRVLITSAIQGRVDKLYGLKENVIIGRQIPVGTGYHGIELEPQEVEQP
ncbi:DNA-directed RNA polymerase subunit beta' [Candidatus Microgenomates bacterium]|nr:DNA-directed RNA polymerase subunit beta' [Candidatus Microgenomates bacterium]